MPRTRTGRRARRDEGGYVAVTTGLLLFVLLGFCAFAIDVGHWYLEGQKMQRAADAGALAGVTRLPADQTGAYNLARQYATTNGYTTGGTTTVTPAVYGGTTRLRVDVTGQVDNMFGGILGLQRTTVSRHAIAEYAGPVPMGSPCNRYGDDPEPNGTASGNCTSTGAFWANVGSPGATKISGDAYQNNTCGSEDQCSGGTNLDYDSNGYTYTVTVKQAVTNLRIEAFDPAQIVVGDYCNNADANLAAADNLGSNAVVSNPAARYAPNAGVWCTGDTSIGTGQQGLTRTQFTVYSPGSNPWNPLSWPQVSGCQRTFEPFRGDLSLALNKNAPLTFKSDVAANFRRWVTLCTIGGTVQPGTYAIQVKTNGLGVDAQSGHNRFGLRAYGDGANDKDYISVAGFTKMAMYGNTPNGTSRFYLARVPSSASGQVFNVRLFDIGDGATSGSTITVVPPTESGSTFAGCKGSGQVNGNLTNCRISVSSAFNGKWQTISVPIPPTYTCDDALLTGCWIRLAFYYGPGSTPADTTSWTASVEGDPIRLVE